MKIFPAIAFALMLSSCATVGAAWNNAPPPDMSPAAMIAGKVCSVMPGDQTPNINATTGWTAKPGAGNEPLNCANKYSWGPYYCSSADSCPMPFSYATHPADPKDRGKTWHGLIDLLSGSILACAQPSNRFGFGSLDCKPTLYTATKDKSIRIVLPVVVPPLQPGAGDQTATTVEMSIHAAPGSGPIVLGQLGFAEQPSQ